MDRLCVCQETKFTPALLIVKNKPHKLHCMYPHTHTDNDTRKDCIRIHQLFCFSLESRMTECVNGLYWMRVIQRPATQPRASIFLIFFIQMILMNLIDVIEI